MTILQFVLQIALVMIATGVGTVVALVLFGAAFEKITGFEFGNPNGPTRVR